MRRCYENIKQLRTRSVDVDGFELVILRAQKTRRQPEGRHEPRLAFVRSAHGPKSETQTRKCLTRYYLPGSVAEQEWKDCQGCHS